MTAAPLHKPDVPGTVKIGAEASIAAMTPPTRATASPYPPGSTNDLFVTVVIRKLRGIDLHSFVRIRTDSNA